MNVNEVNGEVAVSEGSTVHNFQMYANCFNLIHATSSVGIVVPTACNRTVKPL